MSDVQLPMTSWPGSYGDEAQPRVGFFTDTSLCIGCKACEVACKEWNEVPEDGLDFTAQSYDNTGALSANTWRHVAFVEQRRPVGQAADGVGGFGAFFLLLDEPETYGLPPAPRDSTRDLGGMWRSAAVAGVALLAGLGAAFLAGGGGSRQ